LGTIENCEICENGLNGIAIKQEGNPVVHRCHLHKAKAEGVFVYEGGQGSFNACIIENNGTQGVGIKGGNNPHFERCFISKNNGFAVRAYDNGTGHVEQCDLSGNQQRVWSIEDDSQIKRSQNIEGDE
jgi:hypothetical protein